MSKEDKERNDDFNSGEQINYEDYYLDDEEDYLDDDIDDEESEKSIREKKTGSKTVDIDKVRKSSGAVRKKADSKPIEKDDEGKELDVLPMDWDAEKKEPDRPSMNHGSQKKKTDKREIEPDKQKKDADKQHRVSGRIERNLEVQDQEDMKKESVKSSAPKKNNSGKKESGKKKSSPEKSGSQKGSTQKSSTGKSSTGKSSNGKSNTRKTGAKQNTSSNAKSTGGRGRKPKKSGMMPALIAAGVVIGVCVAGYIGVSVYFMNHFYMNTEINGHDFSMKTTADVKEYMEQQVQGYSLKILEKNNQSDSISGEEISLAYKENKDIESVLKKQNAFLWPQAFFIKNSSKATVDVSYDRDALEKKIGELQAVKGEQTAPVSAYPKFNGTEYDVEPEVTGTKVDMDVLKEKIHQYISEFQPELDMEAENCYALPKYTSDSGDVRAACNEMNQYLKASITYSMDQPVVVDKTLVSNWVSADENMKVTFDEGAVREWLREFGKQYDTVGSTRTITSPWGKTVEVSGGTYGWSIDEDAEYPALLTSIKNGETVTREPIYCAGQTAASRGPQDWGTTYAEVDLSGQHMWYIVDGAVALETDVVTGVPTPEKETPSGVYSILEKELNSTLVGEIVPSTGQPEYRTVVAFWMRVTWSGIGFHDATWQPAFGGSLYANGAGSHGCINMPYDQASALYNMMPVGTPVIIHY